MTMHNSMTTHNCSTEEATISYAVYYRTPTDEAMQEFQALIRAKNLETARGAYQEMQRWMNDLPTNFLNGERQKFTKNLNKAETALEDLEQKLEVSCLEIKETQ